MGWAKFDDRRHTNGKLITAGLAANGLDANGITYCAANETDGFVPDDVLPVLAPMASAKQRKELIAKLVTVGRWTRDEGKNGCWIHDFLKFHPSHADLEKKREADRERKKTDAQGKPRDGHGRFTAEDFQAESSRNPTGIRGDSETFHSDSTTPVPSPPVPSPPDPSPPDPRDVLTSVDNREFVGAPDSEPQGIHLSPNEGEKLRELVLMLTSVCTGDNRQRVQMEASLVVALCRPHAPLEVLEESIQAIAAHQPSLPRFLFKQFQNRCRVHGLPVPMLALPEIGKKVS